MSFVDAIFPEQYAYGAVASDDWKNEIVESINRREVRNLPVEHPRRSWDLSIPARTHSERDGIHQWFLAMRGAHHSFAFRDFADDSAARQAIGMGDGIALAFQLVKSYAIGTEAYDRPITRPVTAGVRVWVNGTEQLSGWTASRLTGEIVFATAPADGALVDASCAQFHVPVRFMQPRLSWSAINRNLRAGLLFRCDALSLIEVIGE